MKPLLYIFSFMLLINCSNSQKPAGYKLGWLANKYVFAPAALEVLYPKTEEGRNIKFHFERYNRQYRALKIDSLKTNSEETYRLVRGCSWGYNPFGGNPIAITFYKKAQKYSVVIKEVERSVARKVIERENPVTEAVFDSIRTIFNKGSFWWYPHITLQCWDTGMCNIYTDPDYLFFEAVKNGKHKLVSQLCVMIRPSLVPDWRYSFFVFSNYNEEYTKELKKYRNMPHQGLGE